MSPGNHAQSAPSGVGTKIHHVSSSRLNLGCHGEVKQQYKCDGHNSEAEAAQKSSFKVRSGSTRRRRASLTTSVCANCGFHFAEARADFFFPSQRQKMKKKPAEQEEQAASQSSEVIDFANDTKALQEWQSQNNILKMLGPRPPQRKKWINDLPGLLLSIKDFLPEKVAIQTFHAVCGSSSHQIRY
jgi:hypothetical protein